LEINYFFVSLLLHKREASNSQRWVCSEELQYIFEN